MLLLILTVLNILPKIFLKSANLVLQDFTCHKECALETKLDAFILDHFAQVA